jgi:hypothetical protein
MKISSIYSYWSKLSVKKNDSYFNKFTFVLLAALALPSGIFLNSGSAAFAQIQIGEGTNSGAGANADLGNIAW